MTKALGPKDLRLHTDLLRSVLLKNEQEAPGETKDTGEMEEAKRILNLKEAWPRRQYRTQFHCVRLDLQDIQQKGEKLGGLQMLIKKSLLI
jgi:hypothetical protein